jgi:hypothetical protein
MKTPLSCKGNNECTDFIPFFYPSILKDSPSLPLIKDAPDFIQTLERTSPCTGWKHTNIRLPEKFAKRQNYKV